MKSTRGQQIFRVINVLIMVAVIVFTLAPVLNIVAKSFSDAKSLAQNTVTVIPQGFNTSTYELILADKMFWTNYQNTIVYTLVATAISLFLTVLMAYPLSITRLKGRNLLVAFVVVTMFFNGGIIPNYLLVRSLEMRNTIWAIVIPGAVSTFNVLVMKTFFEAIPKELEEAASVDGLNTYGVLTRIILPSSKAILATMALFYAVGAWNSWFGAFLFLDHQDQYPVTMYLRNIVAGAAAQSGTDADALSQASANVQAVTIVLTALPIICVYPFLQKHFVQGMMVGSVKG